MPLKTSNPQKSLSLWKAASLCSEADLGQIANDLSHELKLGDRVLLEGPMGVGKTTFARTLLMGLKILQPPEGSPTFAIVHEYSAPIGGVAHIDFYRLRSEQEIEDAGILSYYWERNLIVISEWLSLWPQLEKEMTSSFSSPDTGSAWSVTLSFDPDDASRRTIRIFKHQ